MADMTTEAAAVASLARDATTPTDLGDFVHAQVVSDGSRLEVTDAERYQTHPRRPTGTVTLHEPGSFAAYLQRHKTVATQWYVDVERATMVAVLNDHLAAHDDTLGVLPGWRDHRATLTLRHSPEWKVWSQLSGQLVDQVTLAEHLRDHRDDVTAPDAADLLELVQTFQASTGAEFKKAIRLASGETQLEYTETIEASGGRGRQLTIPETIGLSLPVFQGGTPIEVVAEFRYRVREGSLGLGIRIPKLTRIVQDAVTGHVDQITSLVDLEPLYGTAPDPVVSTVAGSPDATF